MEPICGKFGLSDLGCNGVGWGLYLGYVLLALVLLSLIILPIMNMIKAPKEIGKTFMSIGGILVFFLIAYMLSGSEVTVKYSSLGVTEFGSKIIGAGIIMFYLTIVSALGAIVLSEVRKVFL